MPITERPMPAILTQQEYWDSKWERTKFQYPHAAAMRRADVILAYLRSTRLVEPRILDFGCGTGWLSGMLAEIGPTVGIDLSAAAIDIAKQKYPKATFIAGDLYQVGVSKGSFDVVVSQEVIAHVSDQGEYMRMTADALRSRGYLIITTANKFVNDRIPWPPQPPGHIELWLDRQGLERLIRPQFELLKMTTCAPLGDTGVLRLVNSYKLNKFLALFIGQKNVDRLKEAAGFGWTRLALCRKRS